MRDAIQAAQTDAASGGCVAGSGEDVVALPAGHYDLTLAGAHEDANLTGDLDVLSGGGDLTIQGAGSDLTTIDARGIDRVIDVPLNAKVTIDGVEITGGRAPDGGAGTAGEDGGGLRNAASLTLRHSLVDGNASGDGGVGATGPTGAPAPITGGSGGSSTGGPGAAGGRGGGIFSTGGLVIERTRIAGNRGGAGGSGGAGGAGASALSSGSGGSSTGGTGGVGGLGGGIFASLGLHMSESTVVANRSGAGGAGGNGATGGDAAGAFGTSGSSFGGTGGTGADGGGILAGASSEVNQSTVTANETGVGGKGGSGGTGGSNFAGGGQARGGTGGAGGAGAGISGFPHATNVTVAANHAGAGGAGGTGGAGGFGSTGHAASPGGSGGSGGSVGGSDGATLVNATIAGNAAGAGGPGGAAGTTGGGAGGAGAAGTGAAVRDGRLANSIIASNGASGCDTTAPPADDGGNVTFQSGADCPGTAADPGLGSLADNGGATATMAPALPGAAIDAGDSSVACPATDQRGVARPIGAVCDAGAYEAGATVTTGDATGVTLDSASLPGKITPTLRSTTFHFEYGTSTSYGSATPVTQAASSAGTMTVGVTIAGLEPSTTYHYRLVAVNPDATAAFAGADKTFTTAAAPSPPAPQPQTPSDQGQTTTTTPPGGTPTTPPADGTPNVPPVPGTAFVTDSGGALVRLDAHNRFKLPGLSFSCPDDASGKCTAKISIVAGVSGVKGARALASATLKVAPGKAGSATLKASKSLVALVKKKGYVALTAKTTFAAPGATRFSVKKAFVLLKHGR